MKAKYIVYKKKDTSFFFLVKYVQASWWFFLLLNSVYLNYRGRKLYGEQSFLDTLLQQNNEENLFWYIGIQCISVVSSLFNIAHPIITNRDNFLTF